MASLNHSCIVKFYGFCEKRMIVSEIYLIKSLLKQILFIFYLDS
jgi:hypothetical protein